MRPRSAAAGQTDHRDDPVAAGLNADGHVTDITAPLVSGAPRALDISIPCSAIATLPADGGLVVSTLPTGGIDTGQERALRPRQQRRRRRRVPGHGGRGGAALGGGRRRLQRAAHLGRRRVERARTSSAYPAPRACCRREEATGRRDLHRPEGARAAGAVGPHRRRHPVHHGPHRPQEDRDGARRAGRPGRHRRAGRAGPAQPRRHAGQLALARRLAVPLSPSRRPRLADRRHVAGRCGV